MTHAIIYDINTVQELAFELQAKNTTKRNMFSAVRASSMYKSLQYICKDLREMSLHENVIFSVCVLMDSAAYTIFITDHMEFHFRFGHLITYPV